MYFNISTELGNYHPLQILEHFDYPPKMPAPINKSLPSLHPETTGNY